MIAIEIRLNGELKATCGVDDFRQLSAMLFVTSQGATDPGCEVECFGVRPKDAETEEVLHWVKKRIAFGDEVSFNVVHSTVTQEPFDSQVIDRYVEE